MSGTIVGSLDHQFQNATQAMIRDHFVALYNFFNTQMVGAGHCTKIASQFGLAASGFDFTGDPNPAGENAFAVFRFVNTATPFDVLIQWAQASAWGATPGDPGRMHATATIDGIGCAAALREDGSSPWAGSTVADGTDTKGATVWTPGGSVLHMLNRSNAPGGSFATNRENTEILLFNNTSWPSHMHIIGDADGFFHISNKNVTDTYHATYIGKYVAAAGVTVPFPYVHVTNMGNGTGGYWTAGQYGTAAGTATLNEGGILSTPITDDTMFMGLSTSYPWISTSYQPNQLRATASLEQGKIALFKLEGGTSGKRGLTGFIPEAIVGHVFNVANNETNAAGTRAYVAEAPTGTSKFSFHWDGGSPPGALLTRNGRQF